MPASLHLTMILLAALAAQTTRAAEEPDPQQRREAQRADTRVYKATIEPHWFADGTHFWYRNDLPGAAREFILVDAANGVRSIAFDHRRLAEELNAAGAADTRADRLPIENLEFDLAKKTLLFRIGANAWRFNFETSRLEKTEPAQSGAALPAPAFDNIPRRSTATGPETYITVTNRAAVEVELFWLDSTGRKRSYGTIAPGDQRQQHTYAGHVWQVEGRGVMSLFQAQDGPTLVEIVATRGAPPAARARAAAPARPRDESPDGLWSAFIRDANVWVRAKDTGEEIQLSPDGRSDNAYSMLEWSPDSRRLIAFCVEPGDRKQVHLIESSPVGGGRAVLYSRPYDLPGDKFAACELNIFDPNARTQLKADVDRIDFGRPRLRWNADGRRFTYEKIDRGHQRLRLIEVDSHTGETRNVIDEKSHTFIWTAHTESVQLNRINWLGTDEIIYASERDGWRHLYLVDAATGEMKQITRGEFVVRAIDRIDEEHRRIWFRAGGMNPGQDPYFLHHYRINFDGSGLVPLTAGGGDHRIQYSPDRTYIIDTYCRVDMAPVHELRRVSDGQLLCRLEEADISGLKRTDWQPPDVFVAKGRDGTTDIWGIICRPADFDPAKKYPVVEDIYAGPQSAYVPKRFSASRRYASLTDLGFIVVKIDGMGTAHRSKAFHDVCWKNLKDAGFEDRILWMKAAAAKYPYMDLERVGVYGTSAGGQNAAGAVLFHPDFYKVAVASCGCHDNRMDKASWNEQWMGYPVGPQYAESSNIDNARRLGGRLMLIVGEMDTNVPPESTMRLVDALIKADKDFDLVVVPGAGHGGGGAYGEKRRRDFLVRHLLTESLTAR